MISPRHYLVLAMLVVASHALASQGTAPLFSDRALSMGVYASHVQRAEHLRGIQDTLGAGACVLNINNDLWPDLLVLGGTGSTRHFGKPNWWSAKGHNQLYLNHAGVYFQDISGQAGLTATVNAQGCMAGDLDNDGDDDLLITTTGHDLLYRNNGNNTYTLVADSPLAQSDAWTTGAVFVDINGDGLLDVYVAGFVSYQQEKNVFEANTGFRGPESESFSPQRYDAVVSRLYLNKGNMQFEDITTASGIENRSGRTLGVYTYDLNHDRRPDLIELNGFGSDSKAWINLSDGHFAPESSFQDIFDNNAITSLAFADLIDTGNIDAVMGGLAAQPVVIKKSLKEDASWQMGELATRSQTVSTWGISTQDFDNSGSRDLFLADGLFVPHGDAPATAQGQPDQLYLSERGHLVPIQSVPELGLQKSSRTVISADFNNDGAMDLYVSANNGLGQLLMNTAPKGHWIEIIARDGSYKTRPEVVSIGEGSNTEIRHASEAVGFLGKSDSRFHFGLGDQDGPVTVQIVWSDGRVQKFDTLQNDSVYLLSPTLPPCRALSAVRNSRAKCAIDFGMSESSATHETFEPPALIQAMDSWKHHLLYEHSNVSLTSSIAPDTLLEAQENDETVYWLMHALESGEHICEASKMLSHLFDEEEAAIENKYMAMSSLIYALSQAVSPADKACLIETLGHSERYRANASVLSSLNDSQPDVMRTAIIALGRLRQTSSLKALQAIITDESASLAAEALLSAEQIQKGAGMGVWNMRTKNLTKGQRNAFEHALSAAEMNRPLIHRAQVMSH